MDTELALLLHKLRDLLGYTDESVTDAQVVKHATNLIAHYMTYRNCPRDIEDRD